METEKGHHVAWKDRLGLNEQWMRDIIACSAAYGSGEEFVRQVDRFSNDIINIKSGPALHTIIMEEWKKIASSGEKTFQFWRQEHLQESRIDEEVSDARARIREDMASNWYHFILQTLEEHGFGFYQSDISVDDISLTKNNQNIDDDNMEET